MFVLLCLACSHFTRTRGSWSLYWLSACVYPLYVVARCTLPLGARGWRPSLIMATPGDFFFGWTSAGYFLFVTKWIKSCLFPCFGTFKMPILMFISILVFRPEGQILNPARRDTRIYVRRILNASRISKTQLNSCTISPS